MSELRFSRRLFLRHVGFVVAGSAVAACAAPAPRRPQPQRPPCASHCCAGCRNQGARRSGRGREGSRAGCARNECLILENPTGRVVPADDFNRWRPGIQSASTGHQQLALDALWYIDPDAGIDGVWDNALAAEKPIYNKDFTEMTVKLRKGLYWSDGVEFTADDLVYTVDIQKKTPGMAYTGQFSTYVASIEKPDNYTVVFKLTKPNSRFHGLFTVRWSACFMMPKHIFEKQADIVASSSTRRSAWGPTP